MAFDAGTRIAIAAINAACSSRGYELRRDVAYGPLERQRLDLYLPAGGGRGRSMVVFFHGGRWSQGSKGDYAFIAEALTSRGFVTAIANYRLYPSVRFPAFVEDGARALAWARESAEDAGADPERIFVMGHSSGAHIAALLALDPAYLEALGGSPDWITGMIGLAGPYDFLPLRDADLIDIFGPEAGHALSQPINVVGGKGPPMLLLHGKSDTTVGPRNSRKLADKLSTHGRLVDTRYYDSLNHLRIVGALAAPLRFMAPVLDDVTAFVQRYGGKTAPVS